MEARKEIPEVYNVSLTMTSREALLLYTMVGAMSGSIALSFIHESKQPVVTDVSEMNRLISEIYRTLKATL